MTKSQINKLARLEKESDAKRIELAEYKAKLSINCSHPSDRQTVYKWEHDNGYGRQSWQEGIQCGICRKIDLWNSGSWNNRSELTI